MSDERRPRETTLKGHDNRCGLCSLRVYSLWVSEEPPPAGCSDGLDDAPWTCSHVLNALSLGAFLVDAMGRELQPHHHHIIKLIGKERADAIMAYALKHSEPPKAGKMREPNYTRPTIQ